MISGKLHLALPLILPFLTKNVIDFAGTQTDPLAALVFCGPVKPRDVMINGKFVVRDGHLATMPLATLLERHDKAGLRLAKTGGAYRLNLIAIALFERYAPRWTAPQWHALFALCPGYQWDNERRAIASLALM